MELIPLVVVTVASPVGVPQKASVKVVANWISNGSPIIASTLNVHPFASVTVTV